MQKSSNIPSRISIVSLHSRCNINILNFRWGRGSNTLCKCSSVSYWCKNTSRRRHSLKDVQRYSTLCSDVIETRDRILLHFHTGLPHEASYPVPTAHMQKITGSGDWVRGYIHVHVHICNTGWEGSLRLQHVHVHVGWKKNSHSFV